MIQAGKMRHRIKLQKRKISREAQGGESEVWTDAHVSIPAEILPLTMTESFRAQQVNSMITARVKIRYIDGIEAKMRMVFNDEPYDIESVINTEYRNKELILLVTRIST